MKKTLLIFAAAALSITATAISLPDRNAPTREHRAIWMSPFLNNTWPSGNITTANAEARKKSLGRDLDKLHDQGINTIYFHVRANCDANYASSYEPYSSHVAGTRGGTPAFDPFGFFVECAHERGIEVYAWVNPYRYSDGRTYGAGERNYENSHPDWLIRQSNQYILNPGIPEVQDRIEAIITEIVTNYDIDGMIFDDYFYTSGTDFEYDAEQFKANNPNKLDQAAWRRANVNETVRRAYEAVKRVRPYAVFAMGPAGRINPPDIEKYGLEPAPYPDMQYDELHADPIAWIANGWVDFLSPQVYWPDKFDRLTDWYSTVLPHLGRHLYTSVDVSRLSTHKAAEYLREIEYTRNLLRPNENGAVFFDYGAYSNYTEKFNGSYMTWGNILATERFGDNVLQPLHPWRGKYDFAAVSNVRRDGDRIVWDGPADAAHRRYTVYAVPENEVSEEFTCDRRYLAAVTYTESYTIPTGTSGVKYAVAVYDRYGYEYSPLFEGSQAGTVKAPVLEAPAAGSTAADLFDFKWQADKGRYLVEISDSESFSSTLYCAECYDNTLPSGFIANLTDGQTYYWRVRLLRANGAEAVSKAQSFTASRICLNNPANGSTEVSLCPTIEWTAGGAGSEYTVEFATVRDFTNIAYTAVTDKASFTVPECVLKSGSKYFVKVTARRLGTTSESAVHSFSTLDCDYDAPVITNPATDAQVIHSNQCIEVAPWPGMANVSIEISATESFPARSIYNGTLKDFETQSRPLGDIKIGSKALVDGNVYYVRCRGTYAVTTSTAAKRTDYSTVRTFTYSSTAGVEGIEISADELYIEGSTLHVPEHTALVEVYDIAGRRLIAAAPAGRTLDLSALSEGAYIIRASAENTLTLKWVK